MRGIVNLAGVAKALLGCDGSYPGLAHLGNLVDDGSGQPYLLLCDLTFSNPGALRQSQDIEQAKGKLPSQFQLIGKPNTLE